MEINESFVSEMKVWYEKDKKKIHVPSAEVLINNLIGAS